MTTIIIGIVEWILGLVIKDFHFTKSPEVKQKEAGDAKEIKDINSLASGDKPYVVQPNDDAWAKDGTKNDPKV
jgi:hypothetical protein